MVEDIVTSILTCMSHLAFKTIFSFDCASLSLGTPWDIVHNPHTPCYSSPLRRQPGRHARGCATTPCKCRSLFARRFHTNHPNPTCRCMLSKNMTATAANVEKLLHRLLAYHSVMKPGKRYHSGLCRPLLRLEKHRFSLLAIWTLLVRPWQL